MNLEPYQDLLATDISDVMDHGYAMDIGIQALNTPKAKIMGFAYTVRCKNRSNTYMHDAIYSAPAGSVIVAEVDAHNYAVAGGNVCAVAQQNGIAGFVIDGCLRDIGEVNEMGFPVFGRGLCPKPGDKKTEGASQLTVNCGGVAVNPGDLIVADEEGVVVVPKAEVESLLEKARVKKDKAEQTSLAEWRAKHQQNIYSILGKS